MSRSSCTICSVCWHKFDSYFGADGVAAGWTVVVVGAAVAATGFRGFCLFTALPNLCHVVLSANAAGMPVAADADAEVALVVAGATKAEAGTAEVGEAAPDGVAAGGGGVAVVGGAAGVNEAAAGGSGAATPGADLAEAGADAGVAGATGEAGAADAVVKAFVDAGAA